MNPRMLQKWVSPFSLIENLEDANWPFKYPVSWAQENQGLSISETDDSIVVEAQLPGLSENDIEVTFEKGTLMIRGEKKETEEDKKRKYFRRMSSSFMYHMTVPGNVDEASEPKAEFKDGIAVITFKKQKKSEPKRIPVQKRK